MILNISMSPLVLLSAGETGSYRYMAPEVFRHEPYNNKVRQRVQSLYSHSGQRLLAVWCV